MKLHKKLGLVIFVYEFIKSIGSGLRPYLALTLMERYGMPITQIGQIRTYMSIIFGTLFFVAFYMAYRIGGEIDMGERHADVLVTIVVVSIVACVTGYISGFLAIGAQRYTDGYGVLLLMVTSHVFGRVIHDVMFGFSAASLGFFRRGSMK
jgi:small-conductance mechanosensitive channel